MPFELTNVPATFQRMIDSVHLPSRAFMDDGIAWADTYADIVARVRPSSPSSALPASR